MNDTVKWINNNRLFLSYVSCFLLLSSLFGVLWAIVLLATFELIEDNFKIDIFTQAEKSEENVEEKRQYNRKYHFGNSADNIAECFSGPEMYSRDEKQFKNGNFNGSRKQGEIRPSLISLIHKGGKNNKENLIKDFQPLVAVVKNNMHLKQHVHLNQSPKSPLYKNLIAPAQRRKSSSSFTNFSSPSSGFLVHQNSGWYSPTQVSNNTSMGAFCSPSVSLNRSAYDQYGTPDADVNKSVSGTPGLEVHGSYFLNKSLLHSNLIEEEPNFSLVNSNFKSPSVRRVESIGRYESRQNKSSLHDETSTEAVISMLKEKSKRKRQADTDDYTQADQEPVSNYRKRLKVQKNDDFNDTLNELFPPVSSSNIGVRKRVSSIKTSKKRLSTIGTQYEAMGNTEISPKKKVCNNSPGRGRIGLTEEQTDEMMSEEKSIGNDVTDTFKRRQSVESEELESAVNLVKESLAKYKETNKHKVTFSMDMPNSKEDAFSTPVKVSETNGDNEESKNKYSILKSLKSPYKKIFHSPFPSNLTPGSAEKRRKHPVYFTAKIDIDEIQSSREEYGERGASLKAFRLDQEEAKERVNSLLDEAEEVNFKLKGAASTAGSALLSALKKVTTTPSITFATPTPTTTAAGAGGKNVTFNFSAAASSTSSTNSTSGFSFSASTSTLPTTQTATASLPTAATLATSFSIPASSSAALSAAPNGFSFGQNNTAPTTSIPPVPAASQPFSFGNPTSLSTASTNNTSSFSFSNSNATSLSSFGALQTTTTTTASTGQLPAPTFNFGAKSTAATTTLANHIAFPASVTQQPSVQTTQPIASNIGKPPSFQFGAQPTNASAASTLGLFPAMVPAVTTNPSPAANTANVFGNPASSAANIFNAQTTSSSTAGQFSFAPKQTPSANIFGAPATTNSVAPSVLGAQNPATQQPTTGAANMIGPSVTSASANIFSAAPPGASFAFGTGQQPPPAYGTATKTPTTQQQATTANIFAAKPSSMFSFNQTTTTTNNNSNNNSNNNNNNSTGFNFGAKPSSTAGSVFGGQPSTQTQFTAPAAANNVFGSASTQNAFQAPSIAPTTSSTNIFGAAPQNTTNVFGNAGNATNSAFGQPQQNYASTAGGGFQFGVTSNAAPSFDVNSTAAAAAKPSFAFGTTNTTTSAAKSLFGQSTAPSASVFGQPAASTSSVFGQPAGTASGFGQPAATSGSVFGQPVAASSSVFGQQPTTTASVFGQPNSSNIFGNSSATAAAPSVFGSSTNSAPTPFGSNPLSTSVFGNATSNTAPPNPFGQAALGNKSTGFDFSASLKQGPSLAFGGSSTGTAFGAQPSTPAKSSFNFANQPSGTTFGTSATPTFGTQPASTFGTPQSAPFGAVPSFNSPAAPGGGFTMGQANPPRHTQRARRRLKK